MTLRLFLIVPVFTSTAITIAASYRQAWWIHYVFKPLTTCLIILIALLGDEAPTAYKILVIGGLLFSLVGDVFLMLPQDHFMAGLVSFLIAHLFYSAAFLWKGGLVWWVAIPLTAFGSVMLALLWPQLGRLKIPVIIYMMAILMMGWMAINRWLATEYSGAVLAAMGAMLFMVSDSLLALNRFRRAFWSAELLVLSTYFAAQTLIALSI